MGLNKIHLIRHAQSEANEIGLVCGQIDSKLTEMGLSQINEAKKAESIKSLLQLKCFTSHLIRSKMTAEMLGFVTITHANELAETNTGSVSSLKQIDFIKDHPKFKHHNTDLRARYPEGETTAEMIERSISFFNKLYHSDLNEAVLVAHGGPLNAIANYFYY